MSAPIRVTAGPAIERPGDMASLLTQLKAGDLLFIDEIHRLSKIVEEILYPAMEDYSLSWVMGKGLQAQSLNLKVEPFTLVGATTRYSMLSAPLRAIVSARSTASTTTTSPPCRRSSNALPAS